MADKDKTKEQLLKELSRLRKSLELYQIITDHVADAIWIMNVNGEVTFVTPAVENLLGYTAKEFARIPLATILEKDSHEIAGAVLLKAIQDKDTNPKTCKQYVTCKDGTKKWVEVTTSLLADASGTPEAFLVVTRDITERKNAEEALLNSESRYRALFDGSANPIVLYDREGSIMMINPAGAKNLGMPREECIGKSIFALLEDLDTSYHELYHRVLDEDRRICREDRVDLPAGTRWFWSVLEPVADSQGRYGILAISYDISEHKKTQKELEKAQKLESLGVLAGGIAHDFNNLLAGLFGYIGIAREYAKTDKVLKAYLDKAMSAFTRAKELTHQLLTFATGGAPIRKAISLDTVLNKCIHLSLGGSRISCQQKISRDLRKVHADSRQLAQAFNNILVNSRQSMPNGGTITINACDKFIKKGQVPYLAEGQYVEILIQDQGTGIPENVIPKVFDPFFTTKQASSGLGLATAYSIIKRHEGHIAISSQMGRSTTVTILLPVSSEKELLEVVV